MEHDRNKIFIEIVFLISVEFLHLKLWAVSPRLICQYVDTQPTRAQPLLLLTSFYMGSIPDICHFFSTDTIVGVNRDKIAESMKLHTIQRMYCMHRMTQMTDVETSKISAWGLYSWLGSLTVFFSAWQECIRLGPSYTLDSSE